MVDYIQNRDKYEFSQASIDAAIEQDKLIREYIAEKLGLEPKEE